MNHRHTLMKFSFVKFIQKYTSKLVQCRRTYNSLSFYLVYNHQEATETIVISQRCDRVLLQPEISNRLK